MNEMTKSRSDKPHYANTFSQSPSDGLQPMARSSGELVARSISAYSDDRIAGYFGVERVKVSALRAYYDWLDSAPWT